MYYYEITRAGWEEHRRKNEFWISTKKIYDSLNFQNGINDIPLRIHLKPNRMWVQKWTSFTVAYFNQTSSITSGFEFEIRASSFLTHELDLKEDWNSVSKKKFEQKKTELLKNQEWRDVRNILIWNWNIGWQYKE